MVDLLEVKCIGENYRPPLLFVHGAWHGAWCWKPLMKYLSEKGFNSYAIDLPGHGRRQSEGVSGLGIMDYVATLESTVTEFAPAKPILLGHSMGGLIVQKYLEKNKAPATVLIAPCPAMGSSLDLPIKYALHYFVAGLTATLGRTTAIRNQAMCQRLFFNQISPERLETHFRKLGLESSRAIRQMVLPFFKLKADRITSTPVAVVAAGFDYFFKFKILQSWAEESKYDFLPFEKAAHNLLSKPEEFNLGERVYDWLDQKITTKI